MQSLIEWSGDVSSLLTEMKRRAGVSTDTELARAIGTSQSNVSTWRKRGAVPKAVLLKFERLDFASEASPGHRTMAARMIAIRAAEYAYERSGAVSRTVFYMTVAGAWDFIVKAILADLEKKAAVTKRWPTDLAGELIEDERYLDGVADWVSSLSTAEMLLDLSKVNLPQ